MNHSLRTLLAGSIDYAGMFPPASLRLDRAITSFQDYRNSPGAWLLGRFVCPAGELAALNCQRRSGEDSFRVSAIIKGGDNTDDLLACLDDALRAITMAPVKDAVDVLEARWPIDALRRAHPVELENLVQTVAGRALGAGLGKATIFFEIGHLTDEFWRPALDAVVEALADYNSNTGKHLHAGLKIRTGGASAADVPTSARLADFVIACRDGQVVSKATAGLHQPLRHFDAVVGTEAHGFINLFVLATLIDAHGLTHHQSQAILNETDPAAFHFTPEDLSWRDWSVTIAEIATARQRGLQSFGSCSFTEPWDGLRSCYPSELIPAHIG